MPSHTLFVYGTLRDPDVFAAVVGRLKPQRPAAAKGYRAVFYPSRVYPALIVEPSSSAEGILVSDLADAELAALDTFEGGEYHRLPIEVIVDGSAVTVDAYLPICGVSLSAETWTLEHWRANSKDDFMIAEFGRKR